MSMIIVMIIAAVALLVVIVSDFDEALYKIGVITLLASIIILIALVIIFEAHKNPIVSKGKSVIIEESKIEGAPVRNALVENFAEACTFWDCSSHKTQKFIKYVDLKGLEK